MCACLLSTVSGVTYTYSTPLVSIPVKEGLFADFWFLESSLQRPEHSQQGELWCMLPRPCPGISRGPLLRAKGGHIQSERQKSKLALGITFSKLVCGQKAEARLLCLPAPPLGRPSLTLACPPCDVGDHGLLPERGCPLGKGMSSFFIRPSVTVSDGPHC